MADFENLIAQAKKRGIAVILDMPFNHTATDNVWFQKALAGDKNMWLIIIGQIQLKRVIV